MVLGYESTFLGMGTTLLVSHNLNKQHFLMVGSSLVHPWFLSRPKGSNDYSILGYLHGSTKDGTSRRNLNKSAKVHCVERRV